VFVQRNDYVTNVVLFDNFFEFVDNAFNFNTIVRFAYVPLVSGYEGYDVQSELGMTLNRMQNFSCFIVKADNESLPATDAVNEQPALQTPYEQSSRADKEEENSPIKQNEQTERRLAVCGIIVHNDKEEKNKNTDKRSFEKSGDFVEARKRKPCSVHSDENKDKQPIDINRDHGQEEVRLRNQFEPARINPQIKEKEPGNINRNKIGNEKKNFFCLFIQTFLRK
jgi:hypothetical protein